MSLSHKIIDIEYHAEQGIELKYNEIHQFP